MEVKEEENEEGKEEDEEGKDENEEIKRKMRIKKKIRR